MCSCVVGLRAEEEALCTPRVNVSVLVQTQQPPWGGKSEVLNGQRAQSGRMGAGAPPWEVFCGSWYG